MIDANTLRRELDNYEPDECYEYEHELWLDIVCELNNAPTIETATHIKIQYDNNEYTIKELCDRLSDVEKELEKYKRVNNNEK